MRRALDIDAITLRAKTPVELAAVTAKKTEALKEAPGCERVLVVYDARGSKTRLYVERDELATSRRPRA